MGVFPWITSENDRPIFTMGSESFALGFGAPSTTGSLASFVSGEAPYALGKGSFYEEPRKKMLQFLATWMRWLRRISEGQLRFPLVGLDWWFGSGF